MKSTILRSRLVPAAIAAATLATISIPAAANARTSTNAARAQRPAGLTTPSQRLAQPGPRMI